MIIGGGTNLQRLRLDVLVRKEVLPLHLGLVEKAVVRRHLELGLNGLEDDLLLLRLGKLELLQWVLHATSTLLRRLRLVVLVRNFPLFCRLCLLFLLCL